MIPERFMNSTAKKIVMMIGKKRFPCSLPRISSAICTLTKSSMYSITFCRPLGTTLGLRIANANSTTRMRVIKMRISISRSSSKGVPSNNKAGGKKSDSDGGWNSAAR